MLFAQAGDDIHHLFVKVNEAGETIIKVDMGKNGAAGLDWMGLHHHLWTFTQSNSHCGRQLESGQDAPIGPTEKIGDSVVKYPGKGVTTMTGPAFSGFPNSQADRACGFDEQMQAL